MTRAWIHAYLLVAASEAVFGFSTGPPVTANELMRAVFRASTPKARWMPRQMIHPDQRQREAFSNLRNDTLVLPDYFKSPFHAYDSGNLNWESAIDAKAASAAVLRGAEDVRDEFVKLATGYALAHRKTLGAARPVHAAVLDAGCGVGLSTQDAARVMAALSSSGDGTAVGVDLSPHMLAVAAADAAKDGAPLAFLHAAAEELPFGDGSFDFVQICFVLHEVPAAVASRILREAHRVLRRGGVVGVLDFNGTPKASNPAMQYIFDRTEPFFSEFKVTSDLMPEIMTAAGFSDAQKSVLRSPKHAAWFGTRTAPLPSSPYGNAWTSKKARTPLAVATAQALVGQCS